MKNIKEIRKQIRTCKTLKDIKVLIDSWNKDSLYLFSISSWDYMMIQDIEIYQDSRVHIRFPYMGIRNFKNIKDFSYSINDLKYVRQLPYNQCELVDYDYSIIE